VVNVKLPSEPGWKGSAWFWKVTLVVAAVNAVGVPLLVVERSTPQALIALGGTMVFGLIIVMARPRSGGSEA
jgi:hypothetical protein